MTLMRQLHARQFLVASTENAPVSWYATRELEPGWFLHHDPALTVVESDDGVFVGDLPLFHDGASLDQARRQGGRWASVWPVARQSAMGLLSLYWASNGDTIALGSSAPLVADAVNAPRSNLRVGDYRPNWIVPPLSGFTGVRRLIRDQQLTLRSGEVAHDESNRLRSNGGSLDDRALVLQKGLQAQLRRASELGNLKIALTAGYDSRMIFAAALAEGVDFETYTQSEASPAGADTETAARLSHDAGVRHHPIGPTRNEKSALARWDEHTGGAIRDADRRFLARGMFDVFTNEDILVRGAMFEIGSGTWDALFPGPDTATMPGKDEFERLISRAFRLLPLTKSFVIPAMHEWRQFRLDQPSTIGWRDRLYVDQRGAGWLGGIEQGIGLLQPRSVQLADTSELVEVMTWEPDDPDHAQGREVQKRSIALCDEGLLKVPFNPATRSSRVKTVADNLSKLARGDARTGVAALRTRLGR